VISPGYATIPGVLDLPQQGATEAEVFNWIGCRSEEAEG